VENANVGVLGLKAQGGRGKDLLVDLLVMLTLEFQPLTALELGLLINCLVLDVVIINRACPREWEGGAQDQDATAHTWEAHREQDAEHSGRARSATGTNNRYFRWLEFV
jgi:hypothetical protein